MSYIEIRKIAGREYRYEVTNYRQGNKVKHRRKYLEPVSPVNKMQRKKSTGRKHSVFVRQLTPEEKHELRQAKRDPDAFIRDRAKIILLSNERKTAKDVAARLQKDYARTIKLIKRFNKNGLEILKRRIGTGRPKKITDEQLTNLIETANKIPRDVGLPYSNWTCKLLGRWFSEKYDGKLSSEWIRILLRRNGITYTVPKHKLMKADEKLRNAFKKN